MWFSLSHSLRNRAIKRSTTSIPRIPTGDSLPYRLQVTLTRKRIIGVQSPWTIHSQSTPLFILSCHLTSGLPKVLASSRTEGQDPSIVSTSLLMGRLIPSGESCQPTWWTWPQKPHFSYVEPQGNDLAFSHKGTCHWFRAHMDNPGWWSHLRILNCGYTHPQSIRSS